MKVEKFLGKGRDPGYEEGQTREGDEDGHKVCDVRIHRCHNKARLFN